MLTKRQNMIMTIMNNQKDWIVGKDLAKLLNVSDRTIRNDIAAINEFYADTMIESNIRKGYRIQGEKVKRFIEETKKEIPETGEERRWLILKTLVEHNQVNIYQLADQMCISEFSLENDMNKIRKLLDNYQGLKVIRQSNMLQLSGGEREKRHLYEELISYKISGNLWNLNKVAENFMRFDLLKVKELLKDIFEEFHYQMNEVRIPTLLIHVGVILERNFACHFLKEDEEQQGKYGREEYEISRHFFEKIGARLSLQVREAEICDFAIYLEHGKRKGYCEEEQLQGLASDLVQHIIVEIREHFDIDFSEDCEFRLGLEVHTVSLLKRHYANIEIDHTCLEEVKRKYPLIFEMGVWVCKIMEEHLNIIISENEISFIALHLGSAYERANLRRKYRCLLICPHNQTVKDLCIQKIVNRFQDRMEIVGCMSYFEESLIREKNLDLILTTQPVAHALDIETTEISMFFAHTDEAAVFQTLNRLDQIRYRNNFQFFILNLIREEFFTANMAVEEPEKIISDMCDKLYARGYVKENFKEGVLKRERLSPTSFFHGFAIPHNMSHQETIHSAISTAILKQPVQWGSYEVRFVLLLAITEENRNFLKIFFDWLDDIVSNPEKFARLLEVQDYQSFVNTLL
ncbi:BglG family transcription antiterminator [Faecalimonas umbilicata]|uniref:BglG family transcription antiterminator n=1 Tax=Faecalimonas umbilicata TaxID=1912855 RepID=UPI000E40404F|nr:BglG family transcription antiterminator [Faecalimonas umbilicata]RGC76619.1 transcription antiterminator [Lachnospiraceae bacterium AM25-17]RJU62976.1 transcription antiterminator [Coprococcus sp. AM27-12LB]